MEIGNIIKEVSEGNWFKIPGTNSEIKIRRLKPYEIRGLRRKCMKWETDGRRYSKDLDEEILNSVILDAVVVDWKNIELNGQPLPVNSDNKKLLDDNWDAFSKLWNETFSDFKKHDELARSEEIKN